MKKAISLLLWALLISQQMFAQTPLSFNYQAIARDNAGDVLSNQDISILIRINKGNLAGPPVYTETHSETTNDFGLFTLLVGTGIVQSGIFENIRWGEDSYFLEIQMDETGGNNYSFMGTTQLLSVPYALYAEKSADSSVWDMSSSDIFYTSGNVGIGTSAPTSKLQVLSPSYLSKLASGSQAVFGEHSISGSYGWLGASNEGGFGYSSNGYGLRGSTDNGYAMHGTATGTGYSAYFDGKAYFSGNVGIGTTTPAYKLDVNGTIHATSFSGNGSALSGTGDNLGNHTATGNLKMNNFWISNDNDTEGIYVSSIGDVGIGTNNPLARFQVNSTGDGGIIVMDQDGGGTRPGIQFKNNSTHFISGDDMEDEHFGFYSNFSPNRSYDAKIHVYGKTNSSWGKYIGLKHDGTNGIIDTDAGDILLKPAGGVAINTTAAGAYKLNINGDVFVSGSIKTDSKTGSIIIPPAAFVCTNNSTGYYNSGKRLYEDDLVLNYAGFFAAVYLPNNTTVFKITSYWMDNSTSTGALYFYRTNLSTGIETEMSQTSTYGEQSNTRISKIDNTISNSLIDTETYMYYFYLSLSGSSDLQFYGAKIEYQYDEIK